MKTIIICNLPKDEIDFAYECANIVTNCKLPIYEANGHIPDFSDTDYVFVKTTNEINLKLAKDFRKKYPETEIYCIVRDKDFLPFLLRGGESFPPTIKMFQPGAQKQEGIRHFLSGIKQPVT